MQNLSILCMLLIVISLSTASAAINVYILAGQSNMAGRGGVTFFKNANNTGFDKSWDGVVPAECQPNPSILRLNESEMKWDEAREPLHGSGSGIGPGMPFANALLERDPSMAPIGLVPCAKSGSYISQWGSNTTFYNAMLESARAAVRQGGVLRAFLWYQGEEDSIKLADAEAYSARLLNLFNNVRADLQSPSLPINQVALASGKEFKEMIREAQLHTQLPNVTCVDAAGLPLNSDGLHLTSSSQVKLGKMLAEALLHILTRYLY